MLKQFFRPRNVFTSTGAGLGLADESTSTE
jgi:hypothetical protein